MYNVTIVRIAEYINSVVATRRINNNNRAAVVMKLDVEVVLIYHKSYSFKLSTSLLTLNVKGP